MPPKASTDFPYTRPPRPAGLYHAGGTISGGSGKAPHGHHPRQGGSAETGRSSLPRGGFAASGPRWRPGGTDRAAEPPPVPSAPRPFSPRGRHSPPAAARRQRAGAPSSPLFSSLSPPHPRGEGEPWSHSRPARSCRLFRRCRAAAITRAETRPPNRHPPSQRGNAGAAG